MKAPEKIYIEVTPDGTRYYRDVVKEQRTENSDIEYTRTDAFIGRACEWLKNSTDGYLTEKWGETEIDGETLALDFANYIRGE